MKRNIIVVQRTAITKNRIVLWSKRTWVFGIQEDEERLIKIAADRPNPHQATDYCLELMTIEEFLQNKPRGFGNFEERLMSIINEIQQTAKTYTLTHA